MREFEVEVSIRNNLLKERRTGLGLSQDGIAEAVGIPTNTYNQLENLRLSPWTRRQEWRASAVKLAAFYGVEPMALFPQVIHMIKQPKATRKLAAEEAYSLLSDYQRDSTRSPEEIVAAREELAIMEKELKRLPGDRLKLFLEHQLYGFTLKELSAENGVSKERIRQKVNRAKRAVGETVLREVWASRHNKNCLFCTRLRWSYGWGPEEEEKLMVCREMDPALRISRNVTHTIYNRLARRARRCPTFYLEVDRWFAYLRLPNRFRRDKTFKII